jgi:hypothetical protein
MRIFIRIGDKALIGRTRLRSERVSRLLGLIGKISLSLPRCTCRVLYDGSKAEADEQLVYVPRPS